MTVLCRRLEEQSDTLDAQKARQEEKWIAHEELVREIGI